MIYLQLDQSIQKVHLKPTGGLIKENKNNRDDMMEKKNPKKDDKNWIICLGIAQKYSF